MRLCHAHPLHQDHLILMLSSMFTVPNLFGVWHRLSQHNNCQSGLASETVGIPWHRESRCLKTCGNHRWSCLLMSTYFHPLLMANPFSDCLTKHPWLARSWMKSHLFWGAAGNSVSTIYRSSSWWQSIEFSVTTQWWTYKLSETTCNHPNSFYMKDLLQLFVSLDNKL